MTTVFIIAAALACYHFVGYPVAVILLSRLRGTKRAVISPGAAPSVDLIIAAFNEEKVIAAKLDNALSLSYPSGRYRVVVVTDGSSDSTPQIVAGYADRGVVCLHDPQRRGKSHALNRGVAACTADILVLSDANNFYTPDAIERLVAAMAAPGVGGATGVKKVVEDPKRAASTGDSLYWRYESRIKAAESEIGGTVGADGEIFALRRDLYTDLPADVVNDDMYLTLRLVERGYRLAYEPAAIALEEGSFTIREDFNVKVRMIAGGFQGVMKDLGTVFGSGWFTLRFISHKILRWLMPLMLLVLLVSNIALLDVPLFRWLLVAQAAFYATALLGWFASSRGAHVLALYVPFYFVAMNAAAAAGLYRFLSGRGQSALWTKARR